MWRHRILRSFRFLLQVDFFFKKEGMGIVIKGFYIGRKNIKGLVRQYIYMISDARICLASCFCQYLCPKYCQNGSKRQRFIFGLLLFELLKMNTHPHTHLHLLDTTYVIMSLYGCCLPYTRPLCPYICTHTYRIPCSTHAILFWIFTDPVKSSGFKESIRHCIYTWFRPTACPHTYIPTSKQLSQFVSVFLAEAYLWTETVSVIWTLAWPFSQWQWRLPCEYNVGKVSRNLYKKCVDSWHQHVQHLRFPVGHSP